MTTYHVMEAVIASEQGRVTRHSEQAKPNRVIIRFNYKRMADGTVINPGIDYHLLPRKWLIDMSPDNSDDRLPQPDELDYARLRVDSALGGLNPVPLYEDDSNCPDTNAIIGLNTTERGLPTELIRKQDRLAHPALTVTGNS